MGRDRMGVLVPSELSTSLKAKACDRSEGVLWAIRGYKNPWRQAPRVCDVLDTSGKMWSRWRGKPPPEYRVRLWERREGGRMWNCEIEKMWNCGNMKMSCDMWWCRRSSAGMWRRRPRRRTLSSRGEPASSLARAARRISSQNMTESCQR